MIETRFMEIVVPDGSSEDINKRLKEFTLFGWEPNVSAKQRIKVSDAINVGSVTLKDSEYGDEYTVTLKRDTKNPNIQVLMDLESEYILLKDELEKLQNKDYKAPKAGKGVSAGIPMWVKVTVSIFFFPFGLLIFLIKDKTPEQLQYENSMAFEKEEERLLTLQEINDRKYQDGERIEEIQVRLEEIIYHCRSL